MTTDKHQQLINKAVDQNRVLDGGLTETKAIDNLAYAIKVTKSLNAAVGNMCPRCLSAISEALPSIKIGPQYQEVKRTNDYNHSKTGRGRADQQRKTRRRQMHRNQQAWS